MIAIFAFQSCAVVKSRTPTVTSPDLPPLTAKQMKWWDDAKFGMFIHWGMYAIPAKGEWYMNSLQKGKYNKDVVAQYRKLMVQFNPKHYDPTKWVQIAKAAGMKYLVLTARHHDGFCLWDSKGSIDNFTSMKGAAHRDFVREYVDACRAAHMRVGLYYSLMDWRIPGYYKPHELPPSATKLKKQAYDQVTELTHNYGKIDILWYDGGWLDMRGDDADAAWLWQPIKLNKIVRAANPLTIINSRSGWEGDFDSEEGNSEITGPIRKRAWEKCLNLNRVTWGFNHEQNVMSRNEIVTMLVNVVVRGGNMLLNVGPDAQGVIPPAHAARLREVGDWLKRYGESIYGTRAGPLQPVDRVYGTDYKCNMIYVHCLKSPATLKLPQLPEKIVKATVLTGGKVKFKQNASGISLQCDELPKNIPDTIIKLTFDRPVIFHSAQKRKAVR